MFYSGTIQKKEQLLDFASLGCYSEFDLFGIETTHYQQVEEIDMPGDAVRIQWIKWLVDAGYKERITIAHDIHTKHRLMKFGGHGFSHISLNIIPKMLNRGLSQETIDQ